MMFTGDALTPDSSQRDASGVSPLARRTFLRRFSGLLGGLLAPAALRAAPRKKPSNAAGETTAALPSQKKGAQLRLWKVTDTAQASISLRLLSVGGLDVPFPASLKADAQEYQFTGYADVPAGPATVEVSVPGQPPVQSSRYFMADGKLTLLVRYQNAKLGVEWIDDTPGVNSGGGCVFRIYNLLPASGDIEVSLGTILRVRLSSTHSSLRLSDVKPSVYPITIKGVGDAEKEFSTNLDLDFGQVRRATLLIYPDAYGRIRPRINAS